MNRWFILYSFLVVGFILLITSFSITYMQDIIWNNIKDVTVFVVFILVIAIEMQSIINNYGHSKSLTIPVQKIKICFLLLQLIVISILYYLSQLNIFSFSITLIISNVLFSLFGVILFRREKVICQLPDKTKQKPYSEISKYIYNFSHPLFTLALFTSLGMFFDRWFLQNIVGSIDQGFFHFANRLSILILVFNGAIIPIMQKELVGLNSNILLLQRKYEKFLLIFYFISNFLVCCILFNINTIIDVFLNEQYRASYHVILIVVFGTIFRSLGQFQNVLLISMNKTKIIRNIGLIMAIVGFVLTLIFLSPQEMLFNIGLNLGAIGLSLKFLLLEILSVFIVYIYININLKLSKYFIFKLISISLLLFVCMATVTYANGFIFESLQVNGTISYSLFNILIFSMLIFYWVLRYPNIIGFRKEELFELYRTQTN